MIYKLHRNEFTKVKKINAKYFCDENQFNPVTIAELRKLKN